MSKKERFAITSMALCLTAFGAHAQPGHLRLQGINFDMWCQEQQHLPPARCDKRLPQDDAAFQAYVDTIERYETQQLNREARDRSLNRNFVHYDPTANPEGTPPEQPISPPR